MLDYRLSFDIDVKNSKGIEILIISRKDVPAWKKNNNSNIKVYYNNSGAKINDVFTPSKSDAYAFILNNRSFSVNCDEVKTVEVTLIHNWQLLILLYILCLYRFQQATVYPDFDLLSKNNGAS